MQTISMKRGNLPLRFEKYCKTVLRNHKNNLNKKFQRRNKKVVSYNSLPIEERSQFYYQDDYDTEYNHFNIYGIQIKTKNDLLAEAILSLDQKQKDIILLSYFLDMKNKEIGAMMNLAENTISYHMKKALIKLKKYIEEYENEEK